MKVPYGKSMAAPAPITGRKNILINNKYFLTISTFGIILIIDK
jgi:hypothetical protein